MYCCTPKALYNHVGGGGGGSLLNHHQCAASTWMMQRQPQDTGVTTLLFMRSAMGFLMITESQDLGLTSHPKDGAFLQYSVTVTILGR